jgi:hypothetical protein
MIPASIAVPMFTVFAAGVTDGGISGLMNSLQDTIALGVVAGLVLGKALGITTSTFLVTRLPGLSIDPTIQRSNDPTIQRSNGSIWSEWVSLEASASPCPCSSVNSPSALVANPITV